MVDSFFFFKNFQKMNISCINNSFAETDNLKTSMIKPEEIKSLQQTNIISHTQISNEMTCNYVSNYVINNKIKQKYYTLPLLKRVDQITSCKEKKDEDVNKITNNQSNQSSNSNQKCDSPSEKKSHKRTRVPFTSEEDEKIKILVKQYGTHQWSIISSFLPGRSPKQVRDRYSNYLVPGYFQGEWKNEEDLLLRKLYNQYGPKWSYIQQYFPRRSKNSIKNRWNYFLCRQTFNSTDGENDQLKKDKIKFVSVKSDIESFSLITKNEDALLSNSLQKCFDINEPEQNFNVLDFIDQENDFLKDLDNWNIGI